MANLKNITNLPLAESTEGLNLIVNDNGAAKQISAQAVGAQADWAETDENSPAFVKNKPTVNNEGFDLDIKTVYDINDNVDAGIIVSNYTIQYLNDFENIKNKFFGVGVLPKAIIRAFIPPPENSSIYGIGLVEPFDIMYMPEGFEGEGSPDAIVFVFDAPDGEHVIYLGGDGEFFYEYPQPSPVLPT